jgi:hypothetical protein
MGSSGSGRGTRFLQRTEAIKSTQIQIVINMFVQVSPHKKYLKLVYGSTCGASLASPK